MYFNPTNELFVGAEEIFIPEHFYLFIYCAMDTWI